MDNMQEFDMNKFNDFAKMIKAGSPVHKINFTLECPNAVVGMYLMTMGNAKEYLDKLADYTDLKNDTLLVFESRHVIECCQIIYGCLKILDGIYMTQQSFDYVRDEIIDILLTKPLLYSDMKFKLYKIACLSIIKPKSDCDDNNKIYEIFHHIIQNIWFVPYGSIDEMAKEAIDEFKKHCGEGENNE